MHDVTRHARPGAETKCIVSRWSRQLADAEPNMLGRLVSDNDCDIAYCWPAAEHGKQLECALLYIFVSFVRTTLLGHGDSCSGCLCSV
jgi:hypothetical protein